MLSFEVHFGGEGTEDLFVRASGRPERGEFARFYGELVADPRFRKGMRILADFRDVDARELETAEVVAIGKSVASREAAWGAARFAIVVADRLGYGLIRMAELSAGLELMTVWPAYTVEEARSWLDQVG